MGLDSLDCGAMVTAGFVDLKVCDGEEESGKKGRKGRRDATPLLTIKKALET